MQNRVLVVDDEPSLLAGLKELLESEGFEVFTASSGRECLEELAKGFKGLILLDIMMPEMDGWDTVKEMVARGFVEDNIISMLTAKEMPGPKMEGLNEYITDYITKPFDPKELVNIVQGYMAYLE